MKANDKLKIVLFAFASFSVLFYVGTFWFASVNYKDAGTFGDAFGFANALFSGGALVMLIYAVILQREELAVIKEERDDTRKLLSGQEELNKLQEEALKRQIIEQSFNAILKNVLDEKDRLYSNQTVRTNSGRVEPRNEHSISTTLREYTKSVLQKTAEPIESRNTLLAIGFFISSLIYIDDIAEKNLDIASRKAMRILIDSIIDDRIKVWVVAFCLSRVDSEDRHKFIDFLRRYSVSAILPEEAKDDSKFPYRAAFEKIMSTSD